MGRRKCWVADSQEVDGVSFYVQRFRDWPVSLRPALRSLTADVRSGGIMWPTAMKHKDEDSCVALLAINKDLEVVGWALHHIYTPTKRSRDYKKPTPFIYFFIRSDHRREGLATEMTNLLSEYFPDAQVYWRPGNKPAFSRRASETEYLDDKKIKRVV